jgi:hypothetical protein
MEKRSRRDFMNSCVSASLLPALLGSAKPGQAFAGTSGEPRSFLEPFNYNGVRLTGGIFKKQYDATRGYYFKLSNDGILKGFRERAGMPAPGKSLGGWYGGDPQPSKDYPEEWPSFLYSRGDVFNAFGQWLAGMARMSRATGDQAMLYKATFLMREWAKTIEPDGFFYYSRNPIAPHYTYEKTVGGLVDLWEFGGVKEAIPNLERITDWAVKNLDRERENPQPKFASGVGGCEWYTLCENLYRAYELTGNSKYKTFGDLWRYPAYWGMFTHGSEPTPYGLHAYSHCNTLSSAAMTYAVTGEKTYLDTLIYAYDWFQRTQCYATGGFGPGEALQAPDGSLGESLENNGDTFETPCGSWAGVKLSRYLMRFTGEARYGDWIEKLAYNGIGAALPLGPEGKTFYYSDYRLGGGRKVYYRAAFPCCSGTFIEAVADYHNIIYFKDAKSLYVNLFVPSEVMWNMDGQEIKVEQETSYPETNTTFLTLRPQKSTSFGVRIRIPEWSEGINAKVNGSPVEMNVQNGWGTIERAWSSGDRLAIQISMPFYLVPIDKQHPDRVAVMCGPIVLVRRQEEVELPSRRNLAELFARAEKPLEFQAVMRSKGTYAPFYELRQGEPYLMYFDLKSY